MELNKIYQGSSLEVLKSLPSESIDMVITSPPYWALRDYGTATWVDGDSSCDHQIPEYEQDPKNPGAGSHISRFNKTNCYKCGAKRVDMQIGLEQTFQEYVNKLCNIFDESKRVLKETGTCWVNLGDTYQASPVSGKQGGFSGRAAKNNPDYGKALLVKKPKSGLPNKCLLQIPSRFAIEMCNRGWILRNEIIWYKRNVMPTSVKDRFTMDFEKLFFFVKSQKYSFETQFEPYTAPMNRWGGDKLVANGESTWDKGTGQITYRDRSMRPNDRGRNKRCVWDIPTKPFKGAHFAVFPEQLIESPIKAGCPEGGTVLDPFMGSGTTAVVANRLNRNYIGIELNKEYIEIAENRIRGIQMKFDGLKQDNTGNPTYTGFNKRYRESK